MELAEAHEQGNGIQVIVAPTEEAQLPLFPKEERIRNLTYDVPAKRSEGLRLLKHVGDTAKMFKALATYAEFLDSSQQYEAIEKNIEVAWSESSTITGDLQSARECFQKATELEEELKELTEERDLFHHVARKEREAEAGAEEE